MISQLRRKQELKLVGSRPAAADGGGSAAALATPPLLATTAHPCPRQEGGWAGGLSAKRWGENLPLVLTLRPCWGLCMKEEHKGSRWQALLGPQMRR